MLFNSFSFLIFFPIIGILYYCIPKKWRWAYLLIVSYYFYINWQPIYALLLLATTLVTYISGLYLEKIENGNKKRKSILIISCGICLLFLFGFKYLNFINESAFHFLNLIGVRMEIPKFQILLPVGISFYTFMAVGYVVDVYRGTVKAERNFGQYALFLSFFPQIASGPIGRAGNLIPQLKSPKSFEYNNIMEGFKLLLWGYFMKLCIADRLGIYVDTVFNNIEQHSGLTILLASIFFTFQIYCDFAGYSYMAIGIARMMGIKLMDNFNRPYFSKSIKEFWGRWHISLSTWFRDYVYIPLGGNRMGKKRHLSNLLITFLVSGLWHGASWTFIIWGGIHGFYQIVGIQYKKIMPNVNINIKLKTAIDILTTFMLVSFAWIFFKAPDLNASFIAVNKIFTNVGDVFVDKQVFVMGLLSLTILGIKDFADEYDCGYNLLHSKYVVVSHITMIVLISYILLFAVLDGGQFIYFQF